MLVKSICVLKVKVMLIKNRIIYFVAFIAFTYFGLIFFETSYISKEIYENGIDKQVEISSVPNCGSSSNTVDVEYHLKTYTIKIGKNDCIEGRYSIGDKLMVKYSSKYDKMVLSTERTTLAFWMSVLFFLIPFYCLVQMIRPFKK